MTYDGRESSRSLGCPDNLYRFSNGANILAYTDGEEPVTVASVDYEPIAINRDALTSSGTLDRAALKIEVPHDSDIAELFRVYPPSEVVGLTIFSRHDGDEDNEVKAVWAGRVLSCGRDGPMATLVCEPVSTSMKRPGLRRRWQYGCPHALYGPQCGANRAANSVTATLSLVNGATLTLEAGWNGSFDKQRFDEGLMEWTGPNGTVLRTILRVEAATNKIVVSGAVSGLANGATVSLSLGCNHLESHCLLFANIYNFGGHPWIPKKNPIGFVNQFY